MKMNRSELKALIKECLVEVLAEGLGDVRGQIAESRVRGATLARQQVPQRPLAKHVPPRQQQRPRVPDAVKTMQALAPGLANVFADPNTVANASKMMTGQSLAESTGQPGQVEGGLYEQIMDQVADLSQVDEFETGATGHWAALAFAGVSSPQNSGDDDT
jgi:hypothetical protein